MTNLPIKSYCLMTPHQPAASVGESAAHDRFAFTASRLPQDRWQGSPAARPASGRPGPRPRPPGAPRRSPAGLLASPRDLGPQEMRRFLWSSRRACVRAFCRATSRSDAANLTAKMFLTLGAGPSFFGATPKSSPRSRCASKVRKFEEYDPSRRSRAPRAPAACTPPPPTRSAACIQPRSAPGWPWPGPRSRPHSLPAPPRHLRHSSSTPSRPPHLTPWR